MLRVPVDGPIPVPMSNRAPLPPEIGRRRTFAIISHPDAGKTTLTEKFLLFGGAIQMAGQVRAKGEARRTIAEGGVSVNNVRVDGDDWVASPSDFLHGRWLVLRRGKRNIAGVHRVTP